MTSIEEIRKRHEAGSGTLPIVGLAQAETDRATLLAEIDRLRSQVLTLEAVGAESADVIDRLMRDSDVARAEIERLLETLRKIYDMVRPHKVRHVPREFMNETVLEVWQIVKEALEVDP